MSRWILLANPEHVWKLFVLDWFNLQWINLFTWIKISYDPYNVIPASQDKFYSMWHRALCLLQIAICTRWVLSESSSVDSRSLPGMARGIQRKRMLHLNTTTYWQLENKYGAAGDARKFNRRGFHYMFKHPLKRGLQYAITATMQKKKRGYHTLCLNKANSGAG